MAKKAQWYLECERRYVQEFQTLEQIATDTGVAERTLRYWKEEGSWENKRVRIQADSSALHSELYELARTIVTSVKSTFAEGKEPSPTQQYILIRLLPLLTKTKDYEDSVAPIELEKPKTGLNEDTKKKLLSLFGLEL